MNQDDWDLYLKSASSSGKRYQNNLFSFIFYNLIRKYTHSICNRLCKIFQRIIIYFYVLISVRRFCGNVVGIVVGNVSNDLEITIAQ